MFMLFPPLVLDSVLPVMPLAIEHPRQHRELPWMAWFAAILMALPSALAQCAIDRGLGNALSVRLAFDIVKPAVGSQDSNADRRDRSVGHDETPA
jgi:hypothetical protein